MIKTFTCYDYLLKFQISNFKIPLGTDFGNVTYRFPNNPFPIGEVTDIFPVFKFFTFSYKCISSPFRWFDF
jgi:hypothetical protein